MVIFIYVYITMYMNTCMNHYHIQLFYNHSRVSQYVYVPTRDHLFQTLDLHADTLEGDVKLPLVLLGYEGDFNVYVE